MKQSIALLTVLLAFSSGAWSQDYDYSELRQDVVYGGTITDSTDPLSKSTVKINSFGTFNCSGTLIAPDVVLTAAHCMAGGMSVEVAGQEIKVAEYKVHPDAKIKKSFFNLSEAAYFDVMILLLERPAQSPAEPVYLPQKGDRISSQEGMVLAGYGCINRMGKPIRGRLSYAYVSSAKYIKPSSKGQSLQLNTSGAACKGDSGGSLYGYRGTKLTILGVTSWGDDIGIFNRFEIVETHLEWINFAISRLRLGESI